jgi:hypothetical protein
MKPSTQAGAIHLVERATDGKVRVEAERVLLLDRDDCVALAVFRGKDLVSDILRLGVEWAQGVMCVNAPEIQA